jgi:hypothetical protein
MNVNNEFFFSFLNRKEKKTVRVIEGADSTEEKQEHN